jgi:hypothetical protein
MALQRCSPQQGSTCRRTWCSGGGSVQQLLGEQLHPDCGPVWRFVVTAGHRLEPPSPAAAAAALPGPPLSQDGLPMQGLHARSVLFANDCATVTVKTQIMVRYCFCSCCCYKPQSHGHPDIITGTPHRLGHCIGCRAPSTPALPRGSSTRWPSNPLAGRRAGSSSTQPHGGMRAAAL